MKRRLIALAIGLAVLAACGDSYSEKDARECLESGGQWTQVDRLTFFCWHKGDR